MGRVYRSPPRRPDEALRYHTSVRLLLLTARPELAVNSRFAAAAAALRLELVTIDATTLSAVVENGCMAVIGPEGPLPLPDAALARVGNWRPDSLLAVLEAIVAQGVATPNPPSAIRLGRDHWATISALAAAGLPVPPTLAGADPEALAAAASRFGLPVVVKQRRSRMGVGAIRCASRDHLEAVLDSLWRLGDAVIVPRWLEEGRESLRLLVAGGTVVAAARFSAAAGEWRSNAARGGAVAPYAPTRAEAALATAAAAALGLGQCGVDLVATAAGPVVLELNPTPGFLRLEAATGVDVARALVEDALRPRPRPPARPPAAPRARGRS
jgi:RimK family alpha-L-glutamate ligase